MKSPVLPRNPLLQGERLAFLGKCQRPSLTTYDRLVARRPLVNVCAFRDDIDAVILLFDHFVQVVGQPRNRFGGIVTAGQGQGGTPLGEILAPARKRVMSGEILLGPIRQFLVRTPAKKSRFVAAHVSAYDIEASSRSGHYGVSLQHVLKRKVKLLQNGGEEQKHSVALRLFGFNDAEVSAEFGRSFFEFR
jgi:hypothetical protein